MNKEEYKSELAKLSQDYEDKKKELARKCANENNPYKIGDFFTDHIGTIKIEKIHISYGAFGEIPYCVYKGTEYKKDGTITKRQAIRAAYQCNDIKNKTT